MRRPAEVAPEGTDAEMRKPFRVRAPTAAPGTRGTAERNNLANSDEAAPTAKKKKNVGVTRMLLCKLTDLELSGAPPLAIREADRCCLTRPLE